MMIDRYLIVDTTFLDAAYRLDLLHHLPQLYSHVFLPVTVEQEFLSKENIDRDRRYAYLTEQYESWTWLKKCNSFSNEMIDLLSAEKSIHRGEAEVIAQTRQLGMDAYPPSSLFALIDERRGRTVAARMGIELTGTLRILASLHFFGLLEYDSSVDYLLTAGHRYSKQVRESAFATVQGEILVGNLNPSD